MLNGLLATLLAEPRLDLGLGPGGLDEVEPIAAGTGTLRLGCEDLDHVAVGELRLEGDKLAVDARSDAAMAHLGVHAVGEVDRGAPLRQRDDVPLGGEDEDLR